MSKIKTALAETEPVPELVDERGPTLERVKQASWGHIEIGDSGVITIRQSPIERAVRRGTFTARQGQAAEKFYQHWFRAGLAGSMGSADPLKVFSTSMDFSRLCKTEMGEFHWNRVTEALEAISEGAEAGGHRPDQYIEILRLVVCQEIGLGEAGQIVWPTWNAIEARGQARSYMRANLNILIATWGL